MFPKESSLHHLHCNERSEVHVSRHSSVFNTFGQGGQVKILY